MIEIILVGLTPPKVQVRNFEIAPEMAGAVTIRLDVVLWSSRRICQPIHSIVLVEIFRMLSDKFGRFGPQRRNRSWRIVEIDSETISLIVVGHESEHIVVDVAEEVHLRLHPPVELRVCKSRMLVEKTTVPATHLMIGLHGTVLNIVLLEDSGRLFKQFIVDPGRDLPMLLGNQFCYSLAMPRNEMGRLPYRSCTQPWSLLMCGA